MQCICTQKYSLLKTFVYTPATWVAEQTATQSATTCGTGIHSITVLRDDAEKKASSS